MNMPSAGSRKQQNPLNGGFKQYGEATTPNTIQYFLRTRQTFRIITFKKLGHLL